jgi:dTDP-4-amino-4,6-dideoxygalactose transaminase
MYRRFLIASHSNLPHATIVAEQVIRLCSYPKLEFDEQQRVIALIAHQIIA